MNMERTIDWDDGSVVIIDQCALPSIHRTLRLSTVDELVDAIARLAVRGAPALGAAGALGVALSAMANADDLDADDPDLEEDTGAGRERVAEDARKLIGARPTAVNLRVGVQRAMGKVSAGSHAVVQEARDVLAEDERVNHTLSERGARLVRELTGRERLRILTHCNAGALATVSWGTALGVVRELAAGGGVHSVLAGETRPLLQGARLTAWELDQLGIPYRLCVDAAAPYAVAQGLVDCVIVGADRIAANGDVANKIGTYSIACAAYRNGVPFVVAAPESTIDVETLSGQEIPIELRDPEEITTFSGAATTVPGADAYNPAFDVTPAELITAIVTESRSLRPPVGPPVG
jgi:methylthioribose-1-phosphate isomerase